MSVQDFFIPIEVFIYLFFKAEFFLNGIKSFFPHCFAQILIINQQPDFFSHAFSITQRESGILFHYQLFVQEYPQQMLQQQVFHMQEPQVS